MAARSCSQLEKEAPLSAFFVKIPNTSPSELIINIRYIGKMIRGIPAMRMIMDNPDVSDLEAGGRQNPVEPCNQGNPVKPVAGEALGTVIIARRPPGIPQSRTGKKGMGRGSGGVIKIAH